MQDSDALRRGIARFVLPSLRGAACPPKLNERRRKRRSNPYFLCGGMDCFRLRSSSYGGHVAVLAKTWMGPICQHDTPSLRGALATKQSILSLRRHGLLPPSLFELRRTRRFARNDGFMPSSSKPLAEKSRALQPISPGKFDRFGNADPHARDDLRFVRARVQRDRRLVERQFAVRDGDPERLGHLAQAPAQRTLLLPSAPAA